MNKKISNLLKDAREHKNLTQKDVANLLCYSPQTISLWESDKVEPKLDSIFAFCYALKLNPFEFLKCNIEDINYTLTFNYDWILKYLLNQIDYQDINKKELEKILNVSRPTLRRILKGEVVLSFTQYVNLCSSLKIDTSYPLEYKPLYETDTPKNKKYINISIISASIVAIIASISLAVGLRNPQNNNSNNSSKIIETGVQENNNSYTTSNSTYDSSLESTNEEKSDKNSDEQDSTESDVENDK